MTLDDVKDKNISLLYIGEDIVAKTIRKIAEMSDVIDSKDVDEVESDVAVSFTAEIRNRANQII